MKKNKLKKNLAKSLKSLKVAEDKVKSLQEDRNSVISKMVENNLFTVKEVSELASMTRQMVYKIAGKKE